MVFYQKMYNNRLIQLLSTFSKKEMTRFWEFTHSPYFNKHEGVRCLVDYFQKIYPKFTSKNCERNYIHKKLFPKQTHNQKELALLFTYSLRLLEQFLSIEAYKKSSGVQKINTLSALRQKQQYTHYERILQQLEAYLASIPEKDNRFYHLQYQLAAEVNSYYAHRSLHQVDGSIQRKQDNLDAFYLSQKLKDACEMQMRSNILKVQYSSNLLDIIIQEIERDEPQYHSFPAILVYYRIYQMLVREEDLFYQAVYPILEEHQHVFTKEELGDIYNYLQHFCLNQYNKGTASYLEEIFRLYKIQLKNDLLLENEILSEWHYKNIVTTAVRLGETAWVYSFIETYKTKLHPDSKTNAYSFNLASYYYSIGSYDEVLELLLKVEYTDNRYTQGVKALLLRTYYDLGEEEALFSLIDSFRQYILRDKNSSDGRKEGFFNLLRFTKRAFQIKMNLPYQNKEKSSVAFQKLQKNITSSTTIFNRSWLLEKMMEIEEKI